VKIAKKLQLPRNPQRIDNFPIVNSDQKKKTHRIPHGNYTKISFTQTESDNSILFGFAGSKMRANGIEVEVSENGRGARDQRRKMKTNKYTPYCGFWVATQNGRDVL